MSSRENNPVEPELVEQEKTYFNTARGNFLQFMGILLITLGVPMLLFDGPRPFGFVLCPLGLALYGVGRFANWYFWYRLQ